MCWFHAKKNGANGREHASKTEIVPSFQDQRDLLIRLVLLITGDKVTAEQSVDNALRTYCPAAQRMPWIEWAKPVTIVSAIYETADAIRSCEPAYKDLRCSHREHLAQSNDAECEHRLSFVLEIDPSIIIGDLDPLARAVLVLRTAIRTSVRDCTLRLNVSRNTVLAAHCRAMAWLSDMQLQRESGGRRRLTSKQVSRSTVTLLH